MNNKAAIPEPAPIHSGEVEVISLVMEDLNARAEFGKQKYGTYLTAHNGRDALYDLYQELLDAVMYIRQVIYERDHL